MGHPANLRRQQRLASTRMDAKLRRRLQKGLRIWQNDVTTPILGGTPMPEKNWEEEMAKLVRRRRAVMDELTWVTRHRRTSGYISPQESATGFTWIGLLMVLQVLLNTAVTTGLPPQHKEQDFQIVQWQNVRQCSLLSSNYMFKTTELALFDIPKLHCPVLFQNLAVRYTPKQGCKATFKPQITALTLRYTANFQTKAIFTSTFHLKFPFHENFHKFKPTAVALCFMPKLQCKICSQSHKAIRKGSFSHKFEQLVKCHILKILFPNQIECPIPSKKLPYGSFLTLKWQKRFLQTFLNKDKSNFQQTSNSIKLLTKMTMTNRLFKQNFKSRYKEIF
jgi:hypothetical protein